MQPSPVLSVVSFLLFDFSVLVLPGVLAVRFPLLDLWVLPNVLLSSLTWRFMVLLSAQHGLRLLVPQLYFVNISKFPAGGPRGLMGPTGPQAKGAVWGCGAPPTKISGGQVQVSHKRSKLAKRRPYMITDPWAPRACVVHRTSWVGLSTTGPEEFIDAFNKNFRKRPDFGSTTVSK